MGFMVTPFLVISVHCPSNKYCCAPGQKWRGLTVVKTFVGDRTLRTIDLICSLRIRYVSPPGDRVPAVFVAFVAFSTGVMLSPTVLTIAGSGLLGGAGIQVGPAFPSLRDLLIPWAYFKTFTALNCHRTSVLTVLTVQNITGIRSVHACPEEYLKDQVSP